MSTTSYYRVGLKYLKIVGFNVGNVRLIDSASGTSGPSNEGISFKGSTSISFMDVVTPFKKYVTQGGTLVLNRSLLIQQVKVLEERINTDQDIAGNSRQRQCVLLKVLELLILEVGLNAARDFQREVHGSSNNAIKKSLAKGDTSVLNSNMLISQESFWRCN